MRRRRLLDAFCGPGGAGMGYARAGFDVFGVDINPQPRYPFAFVQADALDYIAAHGHEFDAIHASPPCQGYSRTRRMHPAITEYPDLIGPTRDALRRVGVPWVLENVPGSPIRAQLLLCGSMFGLEVRRHRYFEADWPMPFPPFAHDHRRPVLNMYQSGVNRRGTDRQYIDAMGVTWATTKNGGEAIPPAYTELIGAAMLRYVAEREAVAV